MTISIVTAFTSFKTRTGRKFICNVVSDSYKSILPYFYSYWMSDDVYSPCMSVSVFSMFDSQNKNISKFCCGQLLNIKLLSDLFLR